MVKEEITYTLTIKIPNFIRYSSENDEKYEERLLIEGKKRARYYLSGYIKDENNEVFSEKITLNNN